MFLEWLAFCVGLRFCGCRQEFLFGIPDTRLQFQECHFGDKKIHFVAPNKLEKLFPSVRGLALGELYHEINENVRVETDEVRRHRLPYTSFRAICSFRIS